MINLLTKEQHDYFKNNLGFVKVGVRCPICYTENMIAKNINDWFNKKTTKPKASCQDCRKQLEARKEREIYLMVWKELSKDFGFKGGF